jgi:hypothetical protein
MVKVFNVHLKEDLTAKVSAERFEIGQDSIGFYDASDECVAIVPFGELRFLSESEAEQEFTRPKVGGGY